LGSRQLERPGGQLGRHAVDFEHDTTRRHARGPEFGRTLTGTHAHFRRLRGHGQIRENPDPDAALTLQVTGDGTTRRFNLARGDTHRLDGLQAVRAEIESGTALRRAVDTALMRLAVLGTLRTQHGM